MAGYAISRLEEIEPINDGARTFRPVRQHFGITTFGMTAVTAAAVGDRLVGEHEETEPESSEELYLVVSGQATFELAGKSHEVGSGTFVHVAPGVRRAAVAREAGTTVIAIGAAQPGRPYTVSGWERFSSLYPLFESGEHEQGADRAAAILADDPSVGASLYYNTACFEALAGRTDAAVAHLRHAIEQAPSMAALARDDEDFASLHDHPTFQQLIA